MRRFLEIFGGSITVAKPLVVVSVVLLIVSLVGVFAARTLPTEVEQKTTLLEYEHEGRFDYLIHLKPSHLFGPPPPEEPPPNPKYPAEIVDTIDFTFRYSPVEWATEVMHIDAILENPGIWHKKVRLIPYTSRTGDFTLRFLLDIEEINELFDDIEEEIGIRQSPRHLTIEAYVTASKERFTQSLPIKLTSTLIEVGTDLKHTQACGNGEFDYVVNLTENSIFDEKTLKPPPVPAIPSSTTTLKPGDVIFSKLVDTIDVTFYYRFKSDRPVSKITTDVEMVASIEATELWSKKFPILYTRKSGDFKVSFPLELADYLELMQTIREETGASAESSSVTITADVHTVAETQVGLIDETFSHPMKVTFAGSILEWDEELSQSKAGSIETSMMVPNPDSYLGLSVAEARVLSTALAVIFSLLSLFLVALYVMRRPMALSLIEKEALRVGKKYRERMAEATSETPIEGEKMISLGSMEDLIKVADELGKPIIHRAPGTSGEAHAYYVFDGATQYQYRLTLGREEQADETGEPEYRKAARKLIEEEMRKAREKDTRAEDEHFQT